MQCTDLGTTVTDPVDYLHHVVSAGFFDSTGGTLTPIPFARARRRPRRSVKRAQKDLYRLIAGMTRAEKIDAGAYVYFTFLRPFAARRRRGRRARLDRPARQHGPLRGALDDRQAARRHHARPGHPVLHAAAVTLP